mmetsp:Transcript_91784/g.218688  ORF Transcript_91784/g.218688 Transcript_91784/m.218688 type:complete len:323 (-) Transcript_91784:1809-2777(-)
MEVLNEIHQNLQQEVQPDVFVVPGFSHAVRQKFTDEGLLINAICQEMQHQKLALPQAQQLPAGPQGLEALLILDARQAPQPHQRHILARIAGQRELPRAHLNVSPINRLRTAVKDVEQCRHARDDRPGISRIHEPGAIAPCKAAHEAQKKEDVKPEDLCAQATDELLELKHAGRHILPLQHLRQVEVLVHLHGFRDELQLFLLQGHHRGHHVGVVPHQIEQGLLGAIAHVRQLLGDALGLSQRTDGQQNQDSLDLGHRRPRPTHELLQLPPLLLRQADLLALRPSVVLVGAQQQSHEAHAAALRLLAFPVLGEDHMRALLWK